MSIVFSRNWKLDRISYAFLSLGLLFGHVSTTHAEEIASFEGGDRIVITYNWKIEHGAKNFGQLAVESIGTDEGRKALTAVAAAAGLNPTIAAIIFKEVPLPHADFIATETKGVISSPAGYTICIATPLYIETSHATWSGRIVRRPGIDGLAYYTAVGTSGGITHRIQGTFSVEYVKPINGWEQKWNCSAGESLAWNQSG